MCLSRMLPDALLCRHHLYMTPVGLLRMLHEPQTKNHDHNHTSAMACPDARRRGELKAICCFVPCWLFTGRQWHGMPSGRLLRWQCALLRQSCCGSCSDGCEPLTKTLSEARTKVVLVSVPSAQHRGHRNGEGLPTFLFEAGWRWKPPVIVCMSAGVNCSSRFVRRVAVGYTVWFNRAVADHRASSALLVSPTEISHAIPPG